jgi:predicted enzyme related to lactoylglutathione lyase
MPPTSANGKIRYVEMPATDVARSADFYKGVFGWNIRKRGDGSTSFDDAVNEVSGTWAPGCSGARLPRSPASSFTSWWTAWPQPLTQW